MILILIVALLGPSLIEGMFFILILYETYALSLYSGLIVGLEGQLNNNLSSDNLLWCGRAYPMHQGVSEKRIFPETDGGLTKGLCRNLSKHVKIISN